MKKCCNFRCWGFGIIIWVVAFVVASIFVAFKAPEALMHTITTLAVVIVAFLLAKRASLSSRKEMLKHSFCWVVIVVALDAIITVQFTGWQFLYSWNMLLAYALILFVPLLAVKSK